MRTPRIPLLRVALLSTWVAGTATTARADGPLVVPDDRSVDVSVEVEPDSELGAEVAPLLHENLPLGDFPGVIGTTKRPAEPADGDTAFIRTRDELLKVGVPLLGVVTLMIVLGAAMRRFGGPLARGGRPSGVLEILGRYPIARGQQLVLLRLVNRVVLLHQTRSGLAALSEVTDPDEVAALLARVEAATRSGQPGRFQGLLAGAAAGRSAVGGEISTPGKVVVDLTRRPAQRALGSTSA